MGHGETRFLISRPPKKGFGKLEISNFSNPKPGFFLKIEYQGAYGFLKVVCIGMLYGALGLVRRLNFQRRLTWVFWGVLESGKGKIRQIKTLILPSVMEDRFFFGANHRAPKVDLGVGRGFF